MRELRGPVPTERAIERAATRRARPAPGTSAEQVRALEARLGRGRTRERLGVSERTMRRYRAGGTPSRVNAEKISRAASISPLREARLRRRGAYVRLSGDIGGGTPGAKRKNTRHRTLGARGFESVRLSGEEMTSILDAYHAGDDAEAEELLRQAMADDLGFPVAFDNLTRLEFLRGDPNA